MSDNPLQHKWEIGRIGPLSYEQMREEYATSLKSTLEHYGGDVTSPYVWGVFLKGTNIKIATTGISPHSEAVATYIVSLHAKVADLESQLAAAQARIAELDPPWTNVTERSPAQRGMYEVTCHGSDGVSRDFWDGLEWTFLCPNAWRPIPPVTPWKGE